MTATVWLIVICYALIFAMPALIIWAYHDLNHIPAMHKPSRHLIRRCRR